MADCSWRRTDQLVCLKWMLVIFVDRQDAIEHSGFVDCNEVLEASV